jgi:hypothetical protein
MVRAALVVLGLAPAGGCSLLLDFGPGAVPADGDDLPYTQADCEYKEPNDSPAEAAPFETTDTGPAAICAGPAEDRDFYRFTVPPGTASVSVRVTFARRPSGDLDLRITDTSGSTTFGQSRGFGQVELVTCPGSSPVCPALGAGDYLFEVFPAVPGAVNRYDIALTLTPM